MADEVNSAPGGGAAVAEAPASAPASTPTTPSAPATPSTPAAAPAPTAPGGTVPAPVSPATVPTRNVGESDRAYLDRTADWRAAQPKDDAVARGDVAPPEPAKPAVAPKEPEVKPAEPIKVEKKPEEAKPVEAVAEKDPLDDLGALPPSKLAEALTKNPELEAQLEAAGLPKSELFSALREGAKMAQIREVGLPDVATAQAAVTAATQLYGLDLAATELKPGDMQSTAGFVSKLMEMSYLLDDEGKPKMQEFVRPDGSKFTAPATDGTVSTLLDNLVDLRIEEALTQAQQLTQGNNEQARDVGERVMAAVHELRQFIKGVAPDAEGQSEEVKAERAQLEAERAAFNQTKTQESDQRFEAFRGDVLKSTNAMFDAEINGLLSQSSLAPDSTDSQVVKEQKEFLRNGVLREIRDGLHARLNAKPLFLSEQEQIGRRGLSARTQTDLVNLYKRYTAPLLEEVARPILQKAGAVRVEASKARAQKIAAQQKDSQTEPKGTTAAVAPKIQKIDQAGLTQEAGRQLMQELKRMPSSWEVMERTKALIAKAGTAATV